MKKIITLFLILALNGCAYIMDGDTQTIYLGTSDNKRVKAVVKNDDTETVYTLPSVVKVKKSNNDLLIKTVETDCITSTETSIPSSLDNWVFGNIANLGLGLILDMNGAMWQYDDNYTVDVKRDEICIKKAKKLNEEMLKLHL